LELETGRPDSALDTAAVYDEGEDVRQKRREEQYCRQPHEHSADVEKKHRAARKSLLLFPPSPHAFTVTDPLNTSRTL
jgi:hypothetical protein